MIGHSLGGAGSLALEKKYKTDANNPCGIVQSKTFGAPVVSGNTKPPLLKKIIVESEIVGASVAGGLSIGASVDSAIGFSDGGLLSGLGADIGKEMSSDFSNRITDTNTSPERVKCFGDPISAFDFNATTIMPSFKQRWNNSAHSYSGLFVKDAVPLHDVERNPLTPSPDDSKTEVITS